MTPILDQIVNAVLYEGYILYPYRASSKKNVRERFTFGRVYPRDYSESQQGAEPCLKQTECLLQSNPGQSPTFEVTVRFLQAMWREVGYGTTESSFHAQPELSVDGALYQTWQEATERDVAVSLGPLKNSQPLKSTHPFSFPATRLLEPFNIESNVTEAAMLRRQEAVEGLLELEAKPIGDDLFKISVRVLNRTPVSASQCGDPDAVLMRTFTSTHTILHSSGGGFVSMIDPPSRFAELSIQCENIGTWPILVGDETKGDRDTMLSSPIILYDFPKIAPESIGSFFDGTEIDEMLTLRVLTMTDREKVEMRQVDEFARRILERTEAAGTEELMKMHGTMRAVDSNEEFFNPSKPVSAVVKEGRELRPGSSVRICPKARADAMDMMLAGKTAVVEAIEEDAEGRIHVGLVVDDDPGKDLGMARQPGHRFFYGLDEIELLQQANA